MFWDGYRWVDERSTPPAPTTSRSQRTRDRLATIPMVLLLPALLFPILSTTAAPAPALAVAGSTLAGHTLAVTGSGFAAGVWVRLRWDGTSNGMPTTRADSKGSLATSIRVPANAAVGDHVLSATGSSWTWNTTTSGAMAVSAPAAPDASARWCHSTLRRAARMTRAKPATITAPSRLAPITPSSLTS